MSPGGRPWPRWSWSEWGWALAWAAALAAVTSVPYVLAQLTCESGLVYLGFVFNPDEPNVHLSWIRQAAEGAVFFRNEFTAEPHVGRFFNLFMLAVGRLQGRLGLDSYQAWQLARLAGVVALALALYLAASLLGADRRQRRLAVGVASLSSGLGWYWAGSEGMGLLNPAPLLSVSLLLMGLVWGEQALRQRDATAAGATAVVALLLHGVPRCDGLALLVGLLAAAVVRELREPADPRWRWGLVLGWLVAGRPGLWFGDGVALAVVLVGAVVYGLLLARAEKAVWLRLAVVAMAALAGWARLGPRLALEPVDVEPGLVMPEAITFLSAYLQPLFAVSVALLTVALVLGHRALRDGSRATAVAAGLTGLLLANIHTYDSLPLLGILAVYLGALAVGERRWSGERAAAFGAIVLLVLPAVAYQAWLIRSDPLYAAKANTITATPPPTTLLVSYGLLVPLALAGAVTLLRRGRESGRFLTCWLLTHAACVWLPTSLFPFQRKMIEGLHVPLALLATVGLLQVARTLAGGVALAGAAPRLRTIGPVWAVRADLACQRASWLRPWAVVGLFVLLPSNLLFVQESLEAVRQNNWTKVQQALMPPFAFRTAEWQAVQWLGAHTPPDAVIGCLPTIGSYLPGRIGRTVYCGHWAETIDFGPKLRAFHKFLTGDGTAAEKTDFLRRAGIDYLYYGSFEQALARGQRPLLPSLQRVYPTTEPAPGAAAPILIYRVLPEPAESTGEGGREAGGAVGSVVR